MWTTQDLFGIVTASHLPSHPTPCPLPPWQGGVCQCEARRTSFRRFANPGCWKWVCGIFPARYLYSLLSTSRKASLNKMRKPTMCRPAKYRCFPGRRNLTEAKLKKYARYVTIKFTRSYTSADTVCRRESRAATKVPASTLKKVQACGPRGSAAPKILVYIYIYIYIYFFCGWVAGWSLCLPGSQFVWNWCALQIQAFTLDV